MSSAFFFKRINDHIQYLSKIEKTLDGKGEFQGTPFDSCQLGIWLYGEGRSEAEALGQEAVSLFDALMQPHKEFHDASHRALTLRAQGDEAGSQRAVTEMMKLSVNLINSLGKLDELGRR